MNIHTFNEDRSWISRIKEAILGIPTGIVMVVIAIYALVWGEFNHAKTTNLLKKIEPTVQVAGKDYADTLDNKIVLYADSIVTDKILEDTVFGVKGVFIKLYRQVKMYQWEEIETMESTDDGKGGKNDKKTYEYSKVWSTEVINSDDFKVKDSIYINPDTMFYSPLKLTSYDLNMGRYRLEKNVVEELENYSPISPSKFSVEKRNIYAKDTFLCLGPEASNKSATYSRLILNGEWIFIGNGTADTPQIGDYKFVFWAIKPNVYTIVAEQQKDSLVAHKVKRGFAISELNCGTNFNFNTGSFVIIKSGENTKDAIFDWAHTKNDIFYLLTRFFGFLFMVNGFKRIFKVLAIIPAWMPFIGGIAGKAVLRFSFTLATLLTFLIAGTTWLIFNNFDNITYWDYYFLVLVFLTSIGAVRAKASAGQYHADSEGVFDVD